MGTCGSRPPLWRGTMIYSPQERKGLLCVDNDKTGLWSFHWTYVIGESHVFATQYFFDVSCRQFSC